MDIEHTRKLAPPDSPAHDGPVFFFPRSKPEPLPDLWSILGLPEEERPSLDEFEEA